MTDPARFRKVAELFDAARQRDPEARAAFLDEACEGDRELRAEVDALLTEHDAYSPLDHGTPAITIGHLSAPTDLRDEPIPERIDRYTIVRRIGRGGMGTVYEAAQEYPRRTVALKVMHPGFVSRRMLSRFQLEAHLLGQLQHPGIAHIYEAGTTEASAGGQPFFAMELIRGGALTEHARDNKLDTRARLELLACICDAVQHAHQRGVIHRDLKPSNILVNENGQPKILDFGVARATDADLQMVTMQTEVGQLIGTLPYMSPEQVLGDPAQLDTRLDVYALGVILYELLADKLPLDVSGRSIADAVHAIRKSDPPRLRSINTTLRGDLDTIVAKAMEKDKERRYQAAADFAADIRRFLGNEPITARPTSTLYQLRKFARRHRVASVAVVTMVLALIAATAASTKFAVRESMAEAAATRRASEFESMNAFLQRMLEQADPWEAGGQVTIATALQRAAAIVDESFADEPSLEAKMRRTIGTTFRGLGLYDDAEQQLRAAVDLHRNEFGNLDRRTLDTRFELARVLHAQDRVEEASTLVDEVLADARETLGPEAPRTLETKALLGQIRFRQGRWDEAEAAFRSVIDSQERTLGPDDPDTIATIELLGWSQLRVGRLEEAQVSFERVHDQRLRSEGEDSPRRVTCLNGLATVAYDQLRYDDAERLYREALDLSRRVFGEDHPEMVVALNGLANMLRESGRRDEAEPLAREVVRIYRKHLGPEHSYTLIAVNNLGAALALVGKTDEAEQMLLENLEVCRRVLGDGHPDLAEAYKSLGVLAYRQQRWEAAADRFAQANRIYLAAFGRPTTPSITMLVNMGTCLNRAERYEEAIVALEEVIAFEREVFAPDHVELSNDLATYAQALEGAGRHADALAACRESLAILEQGDDERHIARRQGLLGGILLRSGNLEEGEATLIDAWNTLTDLDSHEDARTIARQLAEHYESQQREDEAARWLQETQDVLEDHNPTEP